MAEKQTEIDPIAALEALTVEKVDAAIAVLQAEIDAYMEPRIKRMDSLKQCRRICNTRENGMGQRKPRGTGKRKQQLSPTPKSAGFAAGLPDLGRVQAFISVSGPVKPEAIAVEFKTTLTEDLRDMLADERYFRADKFGRVGLARSA